MEQRGYIASRYFGLRVLKREPKEMKRVKQISFRFRS